MFKAITRFFHRLVKTEPLIFHSSHAEGEMLTDDEMILFRAARCADCTERIVEGPSGGLSQNFRCVNAFCGSRFNHLGPFGVERISEPQPLLLQCKQSMETHYR